LPAAAGERRGCLELRLFSLTLFLADRCGFRRVQRAILDGFHELRIGDRNSAVGSSRLGPVPEQFPAASVALGAVVATLAFFFLMFGFCFYALLVGSYEISVLFGKDLRRLPLFGEAARRAAVLVITLVVPAILYFASPLEKVKDFAVWPHVAQKATDLLAPFLNYSHVFDILTVLPLLGFCVLCILRYRARISSAALICSVVLLCAYVVMPRALKGAYFLDTRMPVMLGFMIFAGFMPKGLSARQRAAAVYVFAVLFAARIAFLTDVWMRSNRDLVDVRQVIEFVTPGSRVLTADVPPADNPGWYASMPISRHLPELTPAYWHLAAFVLIDRHAFWPNIFAEESQQPIRIKQPYRDLEAINSPPLDYEDLALQQIPEVELARFPFLTDWNQKFDYVLVLNAEGAPNLDHFLPEQLQLVDHQRIAVLFKIRK
jgi:hypothetical protein